MTAVEGADPLAEWGMRKRAYVLPERKLVYISLAKNACTSLKWMMAEIAGEDPDSFRPGLTSSTTRDDGIHLRNKWQKTPRFGDLDPEVRSQIHPDNGWFVFAVVRDPRSRLFSAWQNKLLMRNPKYLEHAEQPWYPRFPGRAEDIVSDFEKFLAMMEADPDAPLHFDSHFERQVRLVWERTLTYSRIYDIAQIGELKKELSEHLSQHGYHQELRLRHSNDTPLAANAQVFDHGVRERVEALFAPDFERFGDMWDWAKIEAKPAWSKAELSHVVAATELDERIGDLRALAVGYKAESRAALAELAALRNQVGGDAVARPGASLKQLARHRAAAVRRRIRGA